MPYNKSMVTNTKYKASLFSTLFSNPDILRELYCALEGVTLPPDIPVIINTLQDALFMGKLNVININQGCNEGIVKRCQTLKWYSAFVAKVREYEGEGMGLEKAIRQGIRYCIEHDILKEFLKEYGTEVVNMLYAEWDMEEALAVRYEEGREEERNYFLELMDQGLSIDEIKQRLEQKKLNRQFPKQ